MSFCKTTTDSPRTQTISTSYIGNPYGATEYISADTYVIYSLVSSVGSGFQSRVTITHSGDKLKFYKAPSLALVKNTDLTKIDTSQTIMIDNGVTY